MGRRILVILLILVFGVAAFGVRAAERFRLANKAALPTWTAVPYEIDDWRGTDGQFDPLYGPDVADTSLLRVYERGGKPPIIVYAGFYGHLTEIMQIHTPEVCYPAQGWDLDLAPAADVGVYRGVQIIAGEATASKQEQHRLVVWWFNAGSRPVKNRVRYVYTSLALSSLMGRTDGSLVRLEVPFEKGDEARAHAELATFLTRFLPEIDKALPR